MACEAAAGVPSWHEPCLIPLAPSSPGIARQPSSGTGRISACQPSSVRRCALMNGSRRRPRRFSDTGGTFLGSWPLKTLSQDSEECSAARPLYHDDLYAWIALNSPVLTGLCLRWSGRHRAARIFRRVKSTDLSGSRSWRPRCTNVPTTRSWLLREPYFLLIL